MTGQSLLVVVSIYADVKHVLGSKLGHHIMNIFHSKFSASHGLGGEVGVTSGTIPLREQLWCERYVDVVVFSDTAEQVTGNPQLISDRDAMHWTNLILPLARHNLGVGAGDLDSSKEASFVVCVGNGASERNVGTDGAVVRALSTGVAIVGPAEGLLGKLGRLGDKSVLLLDTVPGLLSDDVGVAPDLLGKVSEVGVRGDELLASVVLPVPGLAHNQNVVSASEGVSVVCNWLEDNFTLVSDSLVSAATVVVPFWKISDRGDFVFESSCLRSECDAGAINPDVLCNDLAALVKVEEFLGVLVVKVVSVLDHLIIRNNNKIPNLIQFLRYSRNRAPNRTSALRN